MNLNETTTDPVNINVDLDKGAVSTAIGSFIEAHNALIDLVQGSTNFNADTGEAALLLGDSSLRSIIGQLRKGLSAPADELTANRRYVVDIGIRA